MQTTQSSSWNQRHNKWIKTKTNGEKTENQQRKTNYFTSYNPHNDRSRRIWTYTLYILTFYLTYILTFYFYLAYILNIYLALYLTYFLAFYLYLAFNPAYILAFYLTYIWTFYLALLSDIYSDNLSGIQSGIYSDIPSCILSGIQSGIYSDIRSGISIWHIFWHSI